jgi:hypothetical protein
LGRWTATIQPDSADLPFHAGKTTFFIQVGVFNETGFAGFPDVMGSIVLQPIRGDTDR